MRFSKILLSIFLVLILTSSLSAQTVKNVLLAWFAENPDYKNSRDTFKEVLLEEAKKQGIEVKFTVLDTKGNKDEFIAKLKELEPTVDLIYVTGTPNAVAVKAAGVTKPVIFSCIADPVAAKLVNSLEKPGTNFTGDTCFVPQDKQLKALLLVLPNAKKIGILYNPDDPAPTSQAKGFKAAVTQEGLELIEFFIPATTASADDLAEATKPVIGKVDVLITTQDAKVSPYGEGMIRVANANKIPTYVSLYQLVYKGALVSLGYNFPEAAKIYNVRQALDIFKGKNPAEIPVSNFAEYRLIINSKTANELGIEIPLKALKVASEVVK